MVKPLLAGVLVRVLLALAVVRYGGGLTGDEVGYDLLARNLLAGHGLSFDGSTPTALRPPLYPAFLAAHYALGWPVLVTQALLGLATAWLVYRGVRAVLPAAAPLALWVGMLCPLNAIYYGRLLTESLSAFLLTAAVVAVTVSTSWAACAAGGLCLGAACLTRDVFLPLLVLLPALLIRLAGARRAALYGLCALAVIVPWTFRNLQVLGSPVPVSRGLLGFNLWVGTWELDGSWQTTPLQFPERAFRSPAERELVARSPLELNDPHDELYRGLAYERWRAEPLAVTGTCLRRYPRLWLGTRTDLFELRLARHSPAWYAFKGLAFGWNALLVGLGAVGCLLVLRSRGALLAAPILLTALEYFPLHNTETRYSQPVLPLLCGLAAGAATVLWKRASRTGSAPTSRKNG